MHLKFHFEESAFDQRDKDRLPKLKKDAVPCVIAESQPKRPRLSTDNDVVSKNADHSYARQVFFSDDCFVESGIQLPFPDEPDGSSGMLIEEGEDDVCSSCCQKVKQLELKIRKLQREVRQLKNQQQRYEENVSSFLLPDQIQKLKSPVKSRNTAWSGETIQRALGIRAVAGRNGYEHLRRLHYPLPSYRTLCRRLENAPFAPGIQHDVLQLLQLKLLDATEHRRLCILMVDEMQLKSRLEMDKGLRQYIGFVSPQTLAEKSDETGNELASHSLVFMLRGLTSSWKQTVAYLYTGYSINKEQYWAFTQQVIEACEKCSLKIQAVTTDMGPNNTALWNRIGIRSTKTTVCSSIEHPSELGRRLFFIADPPHLLKNLWNSLLTHKFTLPTDIVEQHKLPCNIVDSSHVKKLIELQSKQQLRMSHKLHTAHVSPSQYEKMRVGLAAQFFSHSTASAIEVCVRLDQMSEDALTTAWFIRFVNDWFDAMNARHKDSALFIGQNVRSQLLQQMIELVKNLTISDRKVWKPVQTGIKLSTSVALELSDSVMKKYRLQYFLTGRLSQDPIENLFSQVRGRGVVHPSCLMFRQALRLVTVSQYLHVPKSASYDDDGCAYLADYLRNRPTTCIELDHTSLVTQEDCEQHPSDVNEFNEECEDLDLCLTVFDDDISEQIKLCSNDSHIYDYEVAIDETVITSLSQQYVKKQVDQTITDLEGSALYDVTGWAVSKVLASLHCDRCTAAFSTKECSDDAIGHYTTVRSYGGLTHPTLEILRATQMAESIFRANQLSLHRMQDTEQVIVTQVLDVLDTMGFDFPDCHDALKSVIHKFVRLRIHEYAASFTKEKTTKRQFGSKTACRSTVIF